jgi:Cu-Zn family superoxide dismutase
MACKAQDREAGRDVLNMQNDAQAVPVNGGMENLGTSTTGAGMVRDAVIRTADGKQVGTVSMREEGGGTVLTVSVQNMPPGTYGMHIHAVGKCEGPKFESAGAHWNPSQKKHGRLNPQGAHDGDLENLTVGAAGSGGVTANLSAALTGGMTPILDQDGASLMIHAKADDYKTDPSGNSGDRIACAVLSAGTGAAAQ